jgi:hypothetical protein
MRERKRQKGQTKWMKEDAAKGDFGHAKGDRRRELE